MKAKTVQTLFTICLTLLGFAVGFLSGQLSNKMETAERAEEIIDNHVQSKDINFTTRELGYVAFGKTINSN